VVIYVLVAFTAIGATKVPVEEFGNIPIWDYLALEKETAIVRAADQVFPGAWGGLLITISALASTMSALNATTYSSARVSFAMGRAANLPKIFGFIHPRRHTPTWAVIISGVLIIAMAWSLPIERVAAAADIMFLFLFIQVNISVMILRNKMPDLDRGYFIPGYPIVPLIGIGTQIGLLVFLFEHDPGIFLVSLGWIVGGLLLYYGIFSQVEALDTPSDILLEEFLVDTEYTVMVPVATHEQARILGKIGAAIAQVRNGDLLALNVARVPPQLSLADGRAFLKEGRSHLETVIEQATPHDVPVHTMIRLGRDVAEAVRKTAIETASDLIIFGWPGQTNTAGRLFGSVIDPIVDNPPTDIALVRYRKERPVRSIIVPVGTGPNSRRAVKMAINMARAEETPSLVHVINIIPINAPENIRKLAQRTINTSLEGVGEHEPLSTELVEGEKVAESILRVAADHDLIIIGASEEPLFRNVLTGNIAIRVATGADVTVIIVKRRSRVLHSVVRQTVLSPSTGAAATGEEPPEKKIVDAANRK